MKKLLLLPIVLSLASACAWENEETLFPEAEFCDTLNVSYSQDVVPIFANNCYSCHNNSNAPDFANGIAFEDYEDASAYGSSILGSIKHMEGFPAMPKGSAMLDSCSISTIEAWVNMGAPDN
ncbi:MAG: hypothetical protein QNK35_07155 [Bacteroides sp.]|nr:hypothetical protein [Bacteroides sp.]